METRKEWCGEWNPIGLSWITLTNRVSRSLCLFLYVHPTSNNIIYIYPFSFIFLFDVRLANDMCMNYRTRLSTLCIVETRLWFTSPTPNAKQNPLIYLLKSASARYRIGRIRTRWSASTWLHILSSTHSANYYIHVCGVVAWTMAWLPTHTHTHTYIMQMMHECTREPNADVEIFFCAHIKRKNNEDDSCVDGT